MQTTYSYNKVVDYDFEITIQKTTEALKEKGFGILTKIDVKAKMKEKLNQEMENYVILGTCNPSSAFEALQAEPEIGLMLPCNVIVYEKEGVVHVSAIRPLRAMAMIDNPGLKPIAEKVEQKLISIIDNL